MSLTRPGGLNSGRAGDNEASPSELCSDVACTGAGARSPNNIVRSQAGNGAVNGDSVRTISHAAFTLASIRVLTGEGKMNANLETPQKVFWRVIVRNSAEVSLDVYVVFLRYRNINGPRVRHLPRSIDADVAAMPRETVSLELAGPYSDINCLFAHQKRTVMSYSASLAGSAVSRSGGNPSDFSERQNGRNVARRLLRSWLRILCNSMLPKFFASWLVILVLVPFTAPFSTCDLTGFVGSARQHHPPYAPRTFGAGRERRHPDEDFTTNAAVPRVPAMFTAGRVRLLPLSSVPLAQTKISSSSARFIWSATSAGYIREHAVLATILRV